MEKAKVERIVVVFLFVLVLVVFSFAERDSKKLDKLYTNVATAIKQQYTAKAAQTSPAAAE
jgi:Tfp pilus assembly protein PilO